MTGPTSGITSLLGFGPANAITLVPTDFSDTLLQVTKNTTNILQVLAETLAKGGSAIYISQDADYPLKNAPLGTYVKYKADLFNKTSQENVTVGNENAVRVTVSGYGDRVNYNGIFYFLLHNNDAYYIGFISNKTDKDKYLPQFEGMVKSFNFVNSDVIK
jgi:hypothetical protein